MQRQSIATRIAGLPWPELAAALDERGYALTGNLLGAAECRALASLYEEAPRFRSRIVMQRHGFGRGEYQYFAAPLPAIVASLREHLYARIAPVARGWLQKLGRPPSYPETLAAFVKQCHEAGQTRPTPLLLRYGAGDYNCLHQDLYGELAFPLQVTFLLSRPEAEFDGGEFLLVEQRPRMQSRAEVIPLRQGEGVIFAVNERPVQGARGVYRVRMRHGVSVLRRGSRTTLGIIFHDAK